MPYNCPVDCQYCRTQGPSHPTHLPDIKNVGVHNQQRHGEQGDKHTAGAHAATVVPEPAGGECKVGRGHHFPHHHHHNHTHNERGDATPLHHPLHQSEHHNQRLPTRGLTPPLQSEQHKHHSQHHQHHEHHYEQHHEQHHHDYLDERIQNRKGAESAIIHLAKKHGLDLDGVRSKALERDLEHIATSLSYSMMAQRVHLDPHAMVGDAPTFQVHRARIRGPEFRTIVQDFETLGNQYGPPADHLSEAGRSRYISAAFNNIVAWFRLMIYNRPENFVESDDPQKHGLRNYFKCFGGCTILVSDIRLNLGIGKDRLTYIAQLIAELEACNLSNEKQGFSVPILGILCDGSSFEYFSYDGYSKSFSRGLLVARSTPGSTAIARVTLPPITQATSVEYIRALRPLCESFYFLLLKGFLAGLEAYIRRARDYGAGDGTRNYGSEGEWELALAKAVFARNKSVEAGEMAMEGGIQQAERLADEARALLDESLASIPSGYQRRVSLMGSFEIADTLTA
ncbi:hypothetical protein DRE_04460 [Drechslerella stenobrocha 248]|uniref:Uncharacterized protein n=1 Tax=Drechslerella stenobrocha 248 TaxID=1043628 RepID=W7HSQ6_9PEZI|nr:hypothetical protein DRE_04460 [Drechslerella stenobrocha 248]